MPELKIEDVKSVVTAGLEAKADATALVTANETIALQGAEIKELTAVVAEVKELAANVEAKQIDVLALGTKDMEQHFDVKAANTTLKLEIKAAMETGRPLDLKTINTGADNVGINGGIAEELGRTVLERARENVAILGLVASKTVGSVDYREMVLVSYPTTNEGTEQVGDPASVWLTTNGQAYENIAMNVGKQYAKPQISREAVNDPHIDIFAHLQSLLAEEISRYWAVQVLYGNGTGDQLRGILGPMRFSAAESFKETIGVDPRNVEFYPAFKTGVADSIGDTDPTAVNSAIDTVIDLTAVLPSKYLGGANFVMNRFTFAEYRKLKDLEGRPLIQFEAGGFQMAGYSVVLEDYMQPQDGSLKAPVIFGDLSKAFALCSIDDFFLVDPYSADGAVTLKYESRKGDLIQLNDAIVILNTAV